MAFKFTNSKGVTYILHGRTTKLKSGKSRTLYFFSKSQQADALDSVPDGYKVIESKNGLPVLKKVAS